MQPSQVVTATSAEKPQPQPIPMWWRWIVTGALLFGLVVVVGPSDLVRTMSQASLAGAGGLILLLFVTVVMACFNAWILLRRLAPIPFADYFSIYTSSWAASLIAPGQTGDVTQVWLLKRYHVPSSCSAAAYVMDKIVSLLCILVTAEIGCFVLLDGSRLQLLILVPIAAMIGGVISVALIRRMNSAAGGFVHRVQRMIESLLTQLRVFYHQPDVVLLNAVLTTFKWGLTGGCYLLAFRVFGSSVDWKYTLLIPAMTTLIGFVPISFGGIGTVEWSAVGLFGLVGVPSATVLSVYIFMRASQFVLAFVLNVVLCPRRREKHLTSGM